MLKHFKKRTGEKLRVITKKKKNKFNLKQKKKREMDKIVHTKRVMYKTVKEKKTNAL